MNIVFTGMRGTGKTTLGQALAQAIEWPFLDLDQMIETELNKKIVQLVEEEGWEAFRKLEKEMAHRLALHDRTIISTGGGTLIDEDNARALKENGHVVLLTCDLTALQSYLNQSYLRPSLLGKFSAVDEVETIWAQRKDRYHAVADTVHDTTNWPDVETLIQKLRNVEGLL